MSFKKRDRFFALILLLCLASITVAGLVDYKGRSVIETPTGAGGIALKGNEVINADRGGTYVERSGPPDANDDASNTNGNGIAYENSVWKDTDTDHIYWCVDPTATGAVWVRMVVATTAGEIALGAENVTTTGSARFGDLIDPQIAGHVRTERVDIQYRSTTPIPLVTFEFDDGLDSAFDIMKPVFDTQGEVACVAIITDTIGDVDRLTWAEATALENAGWEILSHTQSHPDLTGSSDAELVTELGGSKDVIEAQGLTVNNFVNPGHFTDENVRSFIRRYYRSARSTDTGSRRNLSILNTYNLSGWQADDPTEQDMKDEVDTAETNNEWLIFFLHGTDAADATKVGNVIDYIQGKGIDIVTVNQALDLIENVYETGDMNAGRSFSVNAAGDLRANEIHAVGSVSIWNPASPVAHDVGVYYANAHLGLRAYDGDGTDRDVLVEEGTVYFRPDSRRVTGLGKSTSEWGTVWATGMSSSYQDLTYQSARDIFVKTGGDNLRLAIDDTGNIALGDGGTTNYAQISATGDQTFAGSAGFYPRVVSQDGKPAAGTGATQCDAGEYMMWIDTNDSNKVYGVYNNGGTVVAVLIAL